MRIKKPDITAERVCILIIVILIVTPFIIAWWPRGPHWEHYARNSPDILWKSNNTMSESFISSVAIGNIDSDTDTEIISNEFAWNEQSSRVVVREGNTGETEWFREFNKKLISEIALADLNRDNLSEIIFAVYGMGIFVLNGNGSLFWNHTDLRIEPSIFQAPAVSNVLGNSEPEIIMPLEEGKIRIFNSSNGDLLWTHELGGTLRGSIAIGDVDGVDGREIVVNCDDSRAYALKPGNQTPLWVYSWSTSTAHNWMSIPVVGDINQDGKTEVVIMKGDAITVLDGADGTVVWLRGMNVEWSSDPFVPAVGDLSGDGQLEILFIGNRDCIFSLRARDGSLHWMYDGEGLEFTHLSVGDFDGDGKNEVLCGTYGSHIIAINGEDGSNQWASIGAHVEWIAFQDVIAIGDINNNGKNDIVVPCAGSIDLYALEPEQSGNDLYWSCRGGTNDYTYTHNLADIDEDSDGLSDFKERSIGTNTSFHDSDGDTISDSWEYYHGFDPMNSFVPPHEFALFHAGPIGAAAIVVVTGTVYVIILKKSRQNKRIVGNYRKNDD